MAAVTTRSAKEQARAERLATLWLLGVLGLQLGCQVALLFEQLAGLRIGFRIAAFSVGLVGLVLVPGVPVRHPARWPGLVALGIVALNIFHPTTNTLLVGLAQTAMYVAILSPLFWVPRLAVTPAVFGRLVAALWVWHTLSAVVGVLQVYFPGALQPAVSTAIREMGDMAEGMKITLPNGESVWRPMGLTDTPGGAAGAGLFAALFGMGYFVNSGRWWVRAAGLLGMFVGLVCIYVCQVRSLLVMTGVATATFAAVLVAGGWGARAGRLLLAGPAVAVGAFVWALALGGEAVSKRYETLLADNPGAVYYQNRGHFLEHTVEVLLPQYPAGAGLGRWGAMRGFFGDPYDPASTLIYVEIQLTGWLLDGGVPLILAYSAAIAAACWATARIAFGSADRWLAGWAALVLAYDIGAVAITFNYPLFIGQGGMEFWLLNAALFTAAVRRPTRPAVAPGLPTPTAPGGRRA